MLKAALFYICKEKIELNNRKKKDDDDEQLHAQSVHRVLRDARAGDDFDRLSSDRSREIRPVFRSTVAEVPHQTKR